MSDATSADWQRLVDAVKDNTGMLGKVLSDGKSSNSASSSSSRNSAKNTLMSDLKINTGKINRALDNTADHFHNLGGSADTLIRSIKTFAEAFIGGRVVNGLLDAAMGQTRTYRQLTDIGQGFGGSMIEMSKQAAQAGVSTEDFAKMLEKNSTVAAVLAGTQGETGQSLGKLTLSVRDSMRQFGFFGMAISDINDLTGDYIETMRQQGRTSEIATQSTKNGIVSFAKDITDFAAITGKSRREILKATNDALRDVGVTSKFASMGINSATDAQKKALERSIAFGAAMPGETGNMLSSFISKSFGAGSAYFVPELREMFSNALVPGGISILDTLTKRTQGGNVTDGDLSEMVEGMQRLYHQNAQNLNYQYTIGGNADAGKAIQFFRGLEGLKPREVLDKLKAQQQISEVNNNFTKTMLVLEDTFHKFTTFFKEGLMKGLEPIEKSFRALADGPGGLERFRKRFFDLGESIGGLISNVLSEKNLDNMKTMFENITKIDAPALSGFADALSTGTVIVKAFVSIVTFVTDIFGAIYEKFKKLLTDIGIDGTRAGKIAGVGTVVGTAAIYQIMKQFVLPKLLSRAVINVAHATINGLSGGFGGGTTGTGGKTISKFSRLANGAGTYAMIAGAVAAGMELLPDFKGKETVQTGLEYSAAAAGIVSVVGILKTGADAISPILKTIISGTKSIGQDLLYTGKALLKPATSAVVEGAEKLGSKVLPNLLKVGGEVLGGVLTVGSMVVDPMTSQKTINAATSENDLSARMKAMTAEQRATFQRTGNLPDAVTYATPKDPTPITTEDLRNRDGDLTDQIQQLQQQSATIGGTLGNDNPIVVDLLNKLHEAIRQQTEVNVELWKRGISEDRKNVQYMSNTIAGS